MHVLTPAPVVSQPDTEVDIWRANSCRIGKIFPKGRNVAKKSTVSLGVTVHSITTVTTNLVHGWKDGE